MSDAAQFAPTTTADTIFVELFHSLTEQLASEGQDLGSLADAYLSTTVEGYDELVREDQPQLSAIKSNLLNELSAPTMTAKVFFKGLKVLKIESLGLHATTFGPEGKGATAHAALELKSAD